MIQTILQKPFVRFAIVGSIGFLVDLTCMILLSLWLSPMLARTGSFWIAATSNWAWNRHFTFRHANTMNPKETLQQWGHFLFCSGLSFIPNWGCYYFLMKFVLPNSHPHSLLWPYVAMVPGIVLGLFLNYAFSRFWVFNRKPACP
ncbi:GtrA family protein [Marinomonas sp. NPDC078689]|uniref:GtrA family protein n=1 Tax=Marinomonas sp. NPDC078689 TaxID=3364147 RepID=UPI0037CC2D71